MKVCVYGIAKNEEWCAQRFIDRVKQADLVLIGVDADSTDKTGEILSDGGAKVRELSVKPWRYDVGRNAVLDWIPDDVDVCFSVDLDEVPEPDWAARLREIWTPDLNLVPVDFIGSHEPDGTPATRYPITRIHSRKGWRWKYPFHEVPVFDGTPKVSTQAVIMDHWPKPGRKLKDDWPLFEAGHKEYPDDARMAHYYARQLMNLGRLPEAVEEFKRHLALPGATWADERAASVSYMAACYEAMGEHGKAGTCYFKATQELDSRETWAHLAKFHFEAGDWRQAFFAAKVGLSIDIRSQHCNFGTWSWREGLHDIIAVAAGRLGWLKEGVGHARLAVEMNPDDERLRRNLAAYEAKLGKPISSIEEPKP